MRRNTSASQAWGSTAVEFGRGEQGIDRGQALADRNRRRARRGAPSSPSLAVQAKGRGSSTPKTDARLPAEAARSRAARNGNPAPSGNTTTAVAAGHDTDGITVRNGSISGFIVGADLGGDGSIVEGLRVIGVGGPRNFGIIATGIVKGNTVVGIVGLPGSGIGISATGIITGNYVTGSRSKRMEVGQGSTVIGNTVVSPSEFGISVSCPSNVTDNTFAAGNLNLVGNGCNNTNNVAP